MTSFYPLLPDIVADPSAPDAFVEGIYEGREWVTVDGKSRKATIEELRLLLTTHQPQELQERKISAFAAFLKYINYK